LREDIGEITNLAARMPEKTEQLLARLEAWRARSTRRCPASPIRNTTRKPMPRRWWARVNDEFCTLAESKVAISN
jgi:hypothetical protein